MDASIDTALDARSPTREARQQKPRTPVRRRWDCGSARSSAVREPSKIVGRSARKYAVVHTKRSSTTTSDEKLKIADIFFVGRVRCGGWLLAGGGF